MWGISGTYLIVYDFKKPPLTLPEGRSSYMKRAWAVGPHPPYQIRRGSEQSAVGGGWESEREAVGNV